MKDRPTHIFNSILRIDELRTLSRMQIKQSNKQLYIRHTDHAIAVIGYVRVLDIPIVKKTCRCSCS